MRVAQRNHEDLSIGRACITKASPIYAGLHLLTAYVHTHSRRRSCIKDRLFTSAHPALFSGQAATLSHPSAAGTLPGFPANACGGGNANRLAVELGHAFRRLAQTLIDMRVAFGCQVKHELHSSLEIRWTLHFLPGESDQLFGKVKRGDCSSPPRGSGRLSLLTLTRRRPLLPCLPLSRHDKQDSPCCRKRSPGLAYCSRCVREYDGRHAEYDG
jgi:hypothetical protein